MRHTTTPPFLVGIDLLLQVNQVKLRYRVVQKPLFLALLLIYYLLFTLQIVLISIIIIKVIIFLQIILIIFSLLLLFYKPLELQTLLQFLRPLQNKRLKFTPFTLIIIICIIVTRSTDNFLPISYLIILSKLLIIITKKLIICILLII